MAEYIEREALLDKLNNFCEINCDYTKKQRSVMCGACGIGDAKIMVEDAIAEDVRPVVHGEWFEDSDPGEEYGTHYACSNCHMCYGTRTPPEEICNVYKYCPNCGAKMEGFNG